MAETGKRMTEKDKKRAEAAGSGTETRMEGDITAGTETAPDSTEYDLMSVEETFEALDSLIDSLEMGEGSLEDAFKSYEEGMKLIKSCNGKIDRIEKQVLVLSGEQAEEEEDVVYFK